MIGFLGLTHLGLVSAAGAAERGARVLVHDLDPDVVTAVGAGCLPVHEPGLREAIERAGDRLRFTSRAADLEHCDVIYVAPDVPTLAGGASDVAIVDRYLDVAAAIAPAGSCVVVLSQVQPGFTRPHRPLVERSGRTLAYQVETLVFGRALDRAVRPERTIVGLPDSAVPLHPAHRAFLERFEAPIISMRYESAELCKIAINALLVSSVATTSMLAGICEAVGADWYELIPALRLDARIGPSAYLAPGLGVGGTNLGRDIATIDRLAREHGPDASLVAAWRAVSATAAGWPLRILIERAPLAAADAAVGVWGLAYKQDTASTRGSAGVTLARTLAAAGIRTAAYDPVAEPVVIASPSFVRVDDPLAACSGADALVVTTPWPAFRDSDMAAVRRELRGKLVIDPFGLLDPTAVADEGLTHLTAGRGATGSPC